MTVVLTDDFNQGDSVYLMLIADFLNKNILLSYTQPYNLNSIKAISNFHTFLTSVKNHQVDFLADKA